MILLYWPFKLETMFIATEKTIQSERGQFILIYFIYFLRPEAKEYNEFK